ncbi:MAG: OsmC family protein [Balneolaceae bacterium]|nr:OsmC family protein [Balneolaceae bacterium]MBO6546850.1 OsmC family protein [Balneolaceae bacterium]MBO6649210.1 OsmC family protein [Balneolaceae bacterium]
MQIQLHRQNNAVHLKALNEDRYEVQLDGSEKIGGENLGFRPMQMLLVALGSCASMDVLSILQKQKQVIDSYSVYVDGERESDTIPSLFTDIHVRFEFQGPIDEKKVKRAIELSMGTYCSVTKMLEKTANITSSFILNGHEEQRI